MVWRRMLVVLVWVGLATGQIKPAQQSLTRALELHQSGHYAEAIVAQVERLISERDSIVLNQGVSKISRRSCQRST